MGIDKVLNFFLCQRGCRKRVNRATSSHGASRRGRAIGIGRAKGEKSGAAELAKEGASDGFLHGRARGNFSVSQGERSIALHK